MIVSLDQANDKDVVGNKAVQLAKLTSSIKNIPKGFVVSLDHSDEKELTKYISRNCSAKKLYAVRSSSNIEDSDDYSFAGMFETFLGVNKKNLLKKIREVQASGKTKRLLAFKERIKTSKEAKVAVLIQEMVASEVSGICFTANPTDGSNSKVFIEAGIGLGEFLVGNEITPDQYVFNKKRTKISKKKVNSQHKALIPSNPPKEIPIFAYKQKLSDELIRELALTAMRIEKTMGFPSDIEWAVAKGRLYILQARPITFTKR